MIIISTLIGICIIAIATYVSYQIGIRIARIVEITDPEDESNVFAKVLITLVGAPVIMLIYLAIKIAYELGEGVITWISEAIQ